MLGEKTYFRYVRCEGRRGVYRYVDMRGGGGAEGRGGRRSLSGRMRRGAAGWGGYRLVGTCTSLRGRAPRSVNIGVVFGGGGDGR